MVRKVNILSALLPTCFIQINYLIGAHAIGDAKNIFGTDLESCSIDPMTGYFRDGYCNTNQRDEGTHVVCAIMTKEFLDFTKAQGNDLSTPNEKYRFPGLKSGDGWCLCALRWKEAYEAGLAPHIKPLATHEKALQYVDKKTLEDHDAVVYFTSIFQALYNQLLKMFATSNKNAQRK